jgi:hypothetical protein
MVETLTVAMIRLSEEHATVERTVFSTWSATGYLRQADGQKLPRVEAGYNTSTVVPVSRKRRHKGNTVSDETVKYGYWSSVTELDL